MVISRSCSGHVVVMEFHADLGVSYAMSTNKALHTRLHFQSSAILCFGEGGDLDIRDFENLETVKN